MFCVRACFSNVFNDKMIKAKLVVLLFERSRGPAEGRDATAGRRPAVAERE